MAEKRLGEFLVESGVITEAQLKKALWLQKTQKGFLGQILIEQGWISDKQLCTAISEAIHINCVSLENILISPEVINLISSSLASSCQILPLFVHKNTIYLAMENPRDVGAVQIVEYKTGLQVKPLMAPPCQLHEMIAYYYPTEDSIPKIPAQKRTPKAGSVEETITRGIGFSHRKRLGNVLVESGLLSQKQLDEALHIQKKQKGFLGRVVVEKGWVTEAQLCVTLSHMLNIKSVNLHTIYIDPDVKKYVPDSLAESCNVFPLFVKHNTLFLAMENPLNSGILLYLRYTTGMNVKALVAPPSQIRATIQQYYPS